MYYLFVDKPGWGQIRSELSSAVQIWLWQFVSGWVHYLAYSVKVSRQPGPLYEGEYTTQPTLWRWVDNLAQSMKVSALPSLLCECE